MSTDGTIELQHAEEADAAFEAAIAQLSANNPALFSDLKLKIPQQMFREIVKTFFYLGFAAGESAALSDNE